MKNLNVKLLLTGSMMVVFLLSCSDDFLVEKPTTFVNPDTFLTDIKSAETFTIGAYDAAQNIVSSGANGRDGVGIHWGTMGADEVVLPGWTQDRKLMFLHQVTATNTTVRRIWSSLYQAGNVTNSVIDRIGAMTADQIDVETQNSLIAEARFLRSTIYFALVSAWENVPIVRNEVVSLTELDVPQSSPEETYAFIIEDLEFAKANLPIGQGNGKATKGAAQALLGKVYLQMSGFPLNQKDKLALAEQELKDVIDSGVYGLLDNYAHVFDLDHEQSKEMVFSIGMDGPGIGEGGLLSTFYGPSGSVNNGGGWGTCYVNARSVAKYDLEDARLRNNIAKHNANSWSPEEGVSNPASWGGTDWQWRGWKWHAAKPNNYPNDTPFDNPYIRYADVLLMYAEALNSQGKLTQEVANSTVNRLRERARMTPDAVPAMIVGSQSENAEELLDERYKELCFEGWRRNDLVRFGVYRETLETIDQTGWTTSGFPGDSYEDFEIRWPIPEAEMALNSALVQNEGY